MLDCSVVCVAVFLVDVAPITDGVTTQGVDDDERRKRSCCVCRGYNLPEGNSDFFIFVFVLLSNHHVPFLERRCTWASFRQPEDTTAHSG